MRLLEHIPRLEPVIQILAALEWTDEQIARAGERMVGVGSRILCAALEYDMLTTQSVPRDQLLPKIRAREVRFGTKVVEAVAAMIGAADTADTEPDVSLPFRNAIPGMRLREEIRTQTGALLVPIGFEISLRLIERVTQVAPEVLDNVVRLAPARKM